MIKPLDDHAEMYVSASQSLVHPPCLGIVRHFSESLDVETLEDHALDLASNPYGLGRRVVRPRVPGARSRWYPSPELPPLRIETEAHDLGELSAMLDEEISAQPDPLRNCGWRMAAAPTEDGGTVVLTWANHAFGDARSILKTVFGPRDKSDRAAPVLTINDRPPAVNELSEVVLRLRRGVSGSLRLGRAAASAPWNPERSGEFALLNPTVEALRRRKRTVGTLSSRRVTTLVSVKHEDWRAAAGERGGSSNTLFLAVLTNLLRGARDARGDTLEHPLRILLPVDVSEHLASAGLIDQSHSHTVIASFVNLPGGRPEHGDLRGIRAATKEAVLAAVGSLPKTPSSRPAGIVDAMNLLPNPLTHRIAKLVQADVDGVASNVGPIPDFVANVGNYIADEMYLLAAPMRTDLTGCFGRNGEYSTLSFVADPARLGPGGNLHDRVAEELDAWGVQATIW